VHPSDKFATHESGEGLGVVGAIPARYGSTRLPGKALLPIAGRPMIEHVYERASQADTLDRVVVLTDDERIAAAVEAFGGQFEMTPVDCSSGTDRVAWAAKEWQVQAVINIQGDEPLIDPEAIDRISRHLLEYPNHAIVTLAARAEEGDAANPNVVKVVTDLEGRALYFSRAAIPHLRDQGPSHPWMRHIGIYGYQRDDLIRLAALEPSRLEAVESLEQLRALENGISIRVLQVDRAWPGVDTMEDLERIGSILSAGSGP